MANFSIRGLFKRDIARPSASDVAAADRRRAQELVDRGIAAENSGAAGQALQCYRQAIEADPSFAPAYMNLGIALQATQDLAGAIASYQRAIALDPGYAAARYNLGLTRLVLGEYAQAEVDFRAVLGLRAEFPEAWVALADALEALGRDRDALAALDQAIGQREHYAGALLNAGVLLQKMGRLDEALSRRREADLAAYFSANRFSEAEAVARQIVAARPDHRLGWKTLGVAVASQQRFDEAVPFFEKSLILSASDADTHNGLGNALQACNRLHDAESCFRRALAIKADYAAAHFNLGNCLQALGRSSEAKACYHRALQLRPDFYQGYNNLGIALQALDCLSEAEASYRSAIGLNPDSHEAHYNLANVLQDLGRLGEAETSYRRAFALKPDYVDAFINLGNALRNLGRSSEAGAIYRRALELDPDFPIGHNNLAATLKDLGQFDEAEASCRRALELKPDYHDGYGNLLFVLNYHPDRPAEEIFSAYRIFDERFGRPLRAEWRPHLNQRLPAKRLRVGYVSPDFCRHACRHFIEPLLDHHDKSALEVFAYAEVRAEDEVTARMRARVDRWVPTIGMSDAHLADRIRTDGIDILVDLAGHTRGNRLLVFARKPAPVAVTHLQGFGYTTGLSAIDWCLADPIVVPEGSERLFSEQAWRLSRCMVYRPAEGMGAVNLLPAMKQGHVTFGTLTRAVRINQRVIGAWAEILHRVPGSRLRMDSGDFRDAGLCRVLVEKFAVHGIAGERLEMGFHSPAWDVLREIDISLDCFPHNSATTLFEGLYMGIPFISLAARPSVGRLGSSILVNAGHPEWIAASEEEYVEQATALAHDLPRLAEIRQRLRAEMQASALIDEAGYVRNVEAAYREMWRRWCADIAPATSGITQ
ncbi:MAG: tetratricopeptide repeat protein [Betaproteobacteria bacterium]|nr:tetratricopeptide repeat protein [Betaproteobacteria bacterium]